MLYVSNNSAANLQSLNQSIVNQSLRVVDERVPGFQSNCPSQGIDGAAGPKEFARKQIMMIVEDNHFIQMAVQSQLNQLGVEFKACMNGEQAVETMEAHLKEGKTFDVVLMDLIMPKMNGYKASMAIRQLEREFKLGEKDKQFICGYSAEVNFNTEKICFENGMDDIVAKPMSKETLQTILQEHDRRRPKG